MTKDKAIRRNPLERQTLLAAGVATFALSSGDMTADSMARTFLTAMRSIERALRRFSIPFIAAINAEGRVSVLYDAGGPIKPPKIIK